MPYTPYRHEDGRGPERQRDHPVARGQQQRNRCHAVARLAEDERRSRRFVRRGSGRIQPGEHSRDVAHVPAHRRTLRGLGQQEVARDGKHHRQRAQIEQDRPAKPWRQEHAHNRGGHGAANETERPSPRGKCLAHAPGRNLVHVGDGHGKQNAEPQAREQTKDTERQKRVREERRRQAEERGNPEPDEQARTASVPVRDRTLDERADHEAEQPARHEQPGLTLTQVPRFGHVVDDVRRVEVVVAVEEHDERDEGREEDVIAPQRSDGDLFPDIDCHDSSRVRETSKSAGLRISIAIRLAVLTRCCRNSVLAAFGLWATHACRICS